MPVLPGTPQCSRVVRGALAPGQLAAAATWHAFRTLEPGQTGRWPHHSRAKSAENMIDVPDGAGVDGQRPRAAVSEASALCWPAPGCWPRALAKRPRVRPRQGAQDWPSNRATVVTLMPASSASVCWDNPRSARRRRSCDPSRKNTCGRMRSPAVTYPRPQTRVSTPCLRHRYGPSSGLTGRQRAGPGRSGRCRKLAAARGHPGR